MDQRAPTQAATVTLTAGSTGFRVGLANLRKNWLPLLGLIVVWGSYGRRNSGSWSETLTNLGWTLGGVFVVAVLFYGLYGLSRVELTRDELVVTRMGVRQRLPRSEVAEFIRGSTYSGSRSATPGYYWFITDDRGERFVILPGWLFPENGFEELARALGVETRRATDRHEETRLSPWWMKSMWLTTILTAVVLVAVGALVWWAVVSWQDWRQTRAEDAATRDFVTAVEPQLTTSTFPHLTDRRNSVPSTPLGVSAYAEGSSDVRLRPSVHLGGTDPEVPASEVVGLLDLQCGYSTSGVEVSVALVSYTSDEDSWYDRDIELGCGADPSPLREWLTWAEENPADADLGDRSVEQGTYDGDDFPLQISASLPDASDATFRRAIDHFCAYPAIDTLDVTIRDEDRTRSSIRLNCAYPEAGLAE